VDLQDLLAPVAVGDADLDLAVEPATAPERGSMASTRFVAPMTTTSPRSSSPSISESWATTRRSTSPPASSRLGAMESSSSMKMIAGASSDASSNTSRSFSSDSP